MIIMKRDNFINNWSPHGCSNVFSVTNCKSPKIFSEMKSVILEFNRNFPTVQKFISSKESSYRDIPIKCLSIQEEMYVKNILKSNVDKVTKNAIICKNIRVFLTNDNFDFRVLFYDTIDTNIISIFIGNNFYINENNHLKLIHEIVVNILDKILKMNNINSEFLGGREYLIIKDLYNPSNVEFVFQYYRFLLLAIVSNTNSKVDFEYLKKYVYYYSSLLLFSNESMKIIWNLVNDEISGNDSDYDFRKALITIHENEVHY